MILGGPHEIDEKTYRSDSGLNFSNLKNIRRSPRKALHNVMFPRASSDDQVLGTAIHAAILEPEKFVLQFAPMPKIDRRTKEGKAQYAELETSGKTLLAEKDFEACVSIAETLRANEFYSGLLTNGIYESSWFSEAEGMRIKGRLDVWLPEKNIIVDIKTTDIIDEHQFKRDVIKYSYHAQAAWYMDLVASVTGKPVDGFVILAIEKKEDRDAKAFWLDPSWIVQGRKDYRRWLKTWAHCEKVGVFPGYEAKLHHFSPPSWLIEDEEPSF